MHALFVSACLALTFVATAAEGCGGTIEALSGTITSPSFPKSYPSNKNCTWEINTGYRTTLKFIHFELENEQNCKYDHVEIFTERRYSRSRKYWRFCGSSLPPTITSEGSIRIHFWSDTWTQKSGFAAAFLAEPSFLFDAPQLTSLASPNGSLLLWWTWSAAPSPELAGYYLRGASSDHNFQTTLSPLLSIYTVDGLRGYTEYNITLQPFYNLKGLSKVGTSAQSIVRTPATAPGAPINIVRQSPSRITQYGAARVAITILEPVSWNSSPVGFRLRWEPNEQSNGSMRDFDLSPNAMGRKKDLNVTLSLKPGREYTLFASARGIGDFGEVLIGPETSVTVETTPLDIPTPIITTILSNDTSSIYLEWNIILPRHAPELNPEFEVKVKTNGFFRLVQTVEKAITIGDLSSGAEYEVQVLLSLERTPGKRQYGRPARATVSTWPLVPLAPTLSTRGFQSGPDIAIVSWSFFNSTVTHVEVSTNYSNWLNCADSMVCDEVVLHGWNSSFKAGFVKISELRPHTTYSLTVRGCNDLGCGDENTVVITTDMSEPSEPISLTVNASDDGTSAMLEWKAPDEPKGPLTGYVVSWQCDQDHLMTDTTEESFFAIAGLPAAAQECTFSVSAFNVATDERQLRGKPATLVTPWPHHK
ncbi:uncharacterized protein LOC142576546 isoform X2 [Dermacentor variabilis]|uniref:uncharacterized protein LOC142576546 isoform X2 n=1 Tax=Dermacentor variabilis TaxID=34621 RepID=UPI003F5B2C36